MSDKNFKTIRKQIRNVVQQLLPETWTKEAREAVIKEGIEAVSTEMTTRLNLIETNVKETLAQLDARQKDMQSYIVRSMASLQQPIVSDAPQVGQVAPAAAPTQE